MKQLRSDCQQLISEAWALAEQQQQSAIDAGQAALSDTLSAQLQRLQELQQRNPQVRPAEIEAIRERQTTLQHAIAQPQLSLDALRLIVNVPG